MRILKRNGNYEGVSFDKILRRITKITTDPNLGQVEDVDCDILAQKVIQQIYDGISSEKLDGLTSEIAVAMSVENLGYGTIASRIAISNLQKSTPDKFSDAVEILYTNGLINDTFYNNLQKNKETIDLMIDNNRDYLIEYFGYKTLEKSYLVRVGGKIIERPQYMWMRVALALHGENLTLVKDTYNNLSLKRFIHASPTLFNAGSKREQCSSCFDENSIISTINKGPVKIKDIELGDQVITHKGNVKKVKQLHKNLLNDREFYELNVYKTTPIRVTGNHKFWACKISKNTQEKRIGRMKYDIDFVKNYLKEQGCKLLSKEYKNMKEKINYICICGKETSTCFETMYYKGTRCYNTECVQKRKSKMYENYTIEEPRWVSVEDLQKNDFICIPKKNQKIYYKSKIDISTYFYLLKQNNIDDNLAFSITKNDNTVSIKTIHTHRNLNTKDKDINCNIKHSVVNRYWEINNDFATFVGIFYGDGHVITYKNRKGNKVIRGIGITIHNLNTKLIEFCKKFIEDFFGVKYSLHYTKTQNITQVLISSRIIGEVFNELFGKGFNGKKIWKEMFKWDTILVKNMLEGLITTDGCMAKNGSITLCMSNTQLMKELYFLLRNNNIDVSYGKEKRHENGSVDHVYLYIPKYKIDVGSIMKTYDCKKRLTKDTGTKGVLNINGFTFLEFKNKKLITDNLPKYVYTLGIEDDHSYNVEGLIAENCFILSTEDSLEGIFKTMTNCAKISKFAGGIGLSISNIRAKGSLIKSTNGKSDGLVPMMKVYNEISRYINQGGKRNGSFALYLEPHHADIEEFLEMKKNTGDPNLRARDLFYALWVSDLFMKIVEEDGVWHMFCPGSSPGMDVVYGKEYEELYNKYVREGRFTKTIKARTLWEKILVSQIETGTPYISYKDAVNIKSNQKHLGTITSSNLCNEISLYNTPDSTAVCNIATISLVSCVVDGKFDFQLLGNLTKSLVTNLNRVIDINFYPTPEAEHNNTNYRPVAIGVSGYYDTFMVLKYPFDSEEASVLNKQIFECIQYNAYYRSCELAIEQGPYSAFKGSPMSEGIFQHNMWGLDESKLQYDWAGLRKMIMENGIRNSMLTALPPTASTASILGNVESFEVITSNFYMRNVLSGTFPIINKHLAKDLNKLGLWNKDIVNDIISNDGSIQNIKNIPTELKKLYKTTWETSQKVTVNLSADRGPFIDHTQSLNIFMEKPSIAKLTSMHFYGWKKGLKTGSYYIRSRPITKAEQFTVKQASEELVCSLDNPESCAMCEG